MAKKLPRADKKVSGTAGAVEGAAAPVAVGMRVWVRSGDEPLASGVVIEAIDEMTGFEERGHVWAPVRRWAIALDDGRLVFADTDNLEAAEAEMSAAEHGGAGRGADEPDPVGGPAAATAVPPADRRRRGARRAP